MEVGESNMNMKVMIEVDQSKMSGLVQRHKLKTVGGGTSP